MKEYDVVIIGAGPAGCQCARKLSDGKRKVLVIDKIKDFNDNDFSSAGAPIEIVDQFNLSREVISAHWNQIKISTSKNNHIWKSDKALGIVMDFTKLKKSLLKDAQRKKCEVSLGTKFKKIQKHTEGYIIHFEDIISSHTFGVKAKVIVDATGPQRAVINPQKKNLNLFIGIGLEYLIEFDRTITSEFSESRLDFLLGYK
ncbi:MAG: FAD-dependent oxidoreductase [Patescibacteria group bacterium]|nr:FAD-dependent oxidoreductase [Patescibacteria group bacterium]